MRDQEEQAAHLEEMKAAAMAKLAQLRETWKLQAEKDEQTTHAEYQKCETERRNKRDPKPQPFLVAETDAFRLHKLRNAQQGEIEAAHSIQNRRQFESNTLDMNDSENFWLQVVNSSPQSPLSMLPN